MEVVVTLAEHIRRSGAKIVKLDQGYRTFFLDIRSTKRSSLAVILSRCSLLFYSSLPCFILLLFCHSSCSYSKSPRLLELSWNRQAYQYYSLLNQHGADSQQAVRSRQQVRQSSTLGPTFRGRTPRWKAVGLRDLPGSDRRR